MNLRLLSAADVRAALPMSAAIEVAQGAFLAQTQRRVVAPPRIVLDVAPAGGTTFVMPAHRDGAGIATKVVSVFLGNAARGEAVTQGLVLVCDEATGAPGRQEGAVDER